MHVQSSCFADKTNFFLTLSLSSLLKLPKSLGRIITRGQSISGHVVQAKMWGVSPRPFASDTSLKWID